MNYNELVHLFLDDAGLAGGGGRVDKVPHLCTTTDTAAFYCNNNIPFMCLLHQSYSAECDCSRKLLIFTNNFTGYITDSFLVIVKSILW